MFNLRLAHLSCCLVAAFSFGCGDVRQDVDVDAAVTGNVDAAVAVDAMGNALDAANQTDGGSFGIVSSAYLEGGVIPDLHSCASTNISPALMWGNAPAGTLSFGIVFLDTSTDFLHSAIYDIPASVSELPENVEKVFEPSNVPGAKQPESYLRRRGYAGPCPGSTHTYEFRIHALNVANLGGLTEMSSRSDVVSAIEAASIGSTALTASFTP